MPTPTPIAGQLILASWGIAVTNELLAVSGAWTAFTPVVLGAGGNPNIGSTGAALGRYRKTGKTILWRASITPGGTGITTGNGGYSVAPPTAAGAVEGVAGGIVGMGWIYNTALGFQPFIADGTAGRLISTKNGAQITHAEGLNAAGATLQIAGTYEIT